MVCWRRMPDSSRIEIESRGNTPNMGRRKRALLALVAATCIAAATNGCGGSGSSGGPTRISWYVFKEPGGAFDAAAAACTKASNGKYKVEVVALPTDSDQQREL